MFPPGQYVPRLAEPKQCESHNFAVLGTIIILGSVALVGLIGFLVLAFHGKEIPGEMIAMVAGAIVSLPSMLAQTRSASESQSGASGTVGDPLHAKITNTQKERVPVTESEAAPTESGAAQQEGWIAEDEADFQDSQSTGPDIAGRGRE